MHYDVLEARHLHDFVVRLRFRDGTEGELDLADQLHGPVFEPLKAPSYFRQFFVHPELETLVWPNGADLAPEFLYHRVKAQIETP